MSDHPKSCHSDVNETNVAPTRCCESAVKPAEGVALSPEGSHRSGVMREQGARPMDFDVAAATPRRKFFY